MLCLFAIKRVDGVQYFLPTKKAFSSLPIDEFVALAKAPFFNHGKVGFADYFVDKLRGDVRTGNYRTFNPQKGKLIKSRNVNLETN